MPVDIIVPRFNGTVNLSPEARKKGIDKTPGWKLFVEQFLRQKNCSHTMVYITGGRCSSYEICTKCGYTAFDGGYPE